MHSENLNKKEIKAKTVRNLFIEITKQMIVKESVDEVSVRKVADEAGYTVATIYNHFGSFDALLAQARDSMIDDLAEHIINNTRGKTGKEGIKDVYRIYIDYCLANPNVYQFLFLHHLKTIEKFETSESVIKLAKQFTAVFSGIDENTKRDDISVDELGNTLIFFVHGMLSIYLSDNFALSKKQVYEGLDSIIKIALG